MRHAIAALLALVVLGCGTSGTGEEEVQVTLAFASEPDLERFTNDLGWDIELEEAAVAVGPLAFFAEAPPTASLPERLLQLVVQRAHAHAGFDEWSGSIRAEFLETVVLDLLARVPHPPVELVGFAGPVRSAAVQLHEAPAGALGGAQARVRGVATRGAEVVPFEGALVLPDEKSQRIAGIPADLELGEGTEIVLEVRARRWLREVDFATLEPVEEGAPRPIVPGTQAHAAWYLGARSYGTFVIR